MRGDFPSRALDWYVLGVLSYAVWIWAVSRVMRYLHPDRKITRLMQRETRNWAPLEDKHRRGKL